MTIRLCVAMLYGIAAIGLSLGVEPAQAEPAGMSRPEQGQAYVELAEIESRLTGHAEFDDLPAYMSAARDFQERAERADAPVPTFSTVEYRASVLAPDGPAGLRWSILIRLALMSFVCLGLAFYWGGRNVVR